MSRKGAGPVQRVCAGCGADFRIYPYRLALGEGVFCSQRCYHTATRTHGETAGGRSTEYIIWQGMRRRCLKPDDRQFGNYGGRGITVCDRWRDSFDDFLADMGRRPSPGHSIDRIDVNGNYEPGNARWATVHEQQRNRRNNRLLTLNGVTRCATEWAELLGIGQRVISHRLGKGWSDERTLTTPVETRSTTHCQRGHLFTTENTKVHRTTGSRQCRICIKLRTARPQVAAQAATYHSIFAAED